MIYIYNIVKIDILLLSSISYVEVYMKKVRIAEIVLLSSLINIPLLSCFYFAMQYTHSSSTLNSILCMIVVYIIVSIISLFIIIKDGK